MTLCQHKHPQHPVLGVKRLPRNWITKLFNSSKQQYLKNDPSEILDRSTMPSTRLLSLVYYQIEKGQWKFRMSAEKAEELQSLRASKVSRACIALLVDGRATNSVADGASQRGAMCRATLKQYSQRFMHYLTQKVDLDTGLRTANVVEVQAADRQIWGVISELLNDRNWNMDDALHEVTHVRQDMAGLLQFRPKMNKPQPWTNSAPSSRLPSSPKGKGNPHNPKARGNKKERFNGSQRFATQMVRLNHYMRFQSGKCTY